MNRNTILKLAIAGAISAVLVDYLMKPTINKTVGL